MNGMSASALTGREPFQEGIAPHKAHISNFEGLRSAPVIRPFADTLDGHTKEIGDVVAR